MEKTSNAPEVQGTNVEAEAKSLNKKQKRIAAKKAAKAEAAALLAQSKAAEEAKGDATPPAADEKPKKKKKSDKETLKEESANSIVAKITTEKDLKYVYPDEVRTGKDKYEIQEKCKKFRAGVRRKIESFERRVKTIADALIVLEADPEKNKKELKGKNREMKALEAEYKEYANEVYVKGDKQLA